MFETIMQPLVDFMGVLFPFDCMNHAFMRRAMLGLLLLAPLTAGTGIQVVNSRMSFFSDAIGHSAFAGAALGIVLSMPPELSMPCVALLVGMTIMFMKRKSSLSTDTVIGVIFSGVVALGLAIVRHGRNAASSAQSFLYGDILTISEKDLYFILILMLIYLIFQFFAYNRMLSIAVNPQLASVHRIRTGLYQYLFAALLSFTVIISVKTAGVLLVTALLVVPAAAARCVSKNAASMFWYSLLFSLVSSAAGLLLSAQDWSVAPAGSLIVICSCLIFCLCSIYAALTRGKTGDTEK